MKETSEKQPRKREEEKRLLPTHSDAGNRTQFSRTINHEPNCVNASGCVPYTTSEIFFDLGGRLRTGIFGRDSAKNNDVHEYSKEGGVAKVPVR
jgi:hypothetical protein